MNEDSTKVRDQILAYLQQEFPNADICEESQDDSYGFRVKEQSNSYYLRVMFDAVQTNGFASVTEMLEQYAPANTMRGLGDFPVVVTEQGCMFGSP